MAMVSPIVRIDARATLAATKHSRLALVGFALV